MRVLSSTGITRLHWSLFSFGCVLYEMLTGKHAFEGQNPASVIAAILEREPAPQEIRKREVHQVLACQVAALKWIERRIGSVANPALRFC